MYLVIKEKGKKSNISSRTLYKMLYSRLSLIRFSGGKIIHSNYREIRIIESRSNPNYRLKLAKNRITKRNWKGQKVTKIISGVSVISFLLFELL